VFIGQNCDSLIVSSRNISGFLATPPPNIRAILLHGSDNGLIHERAEILAATVVENLGDPFRVSELTGKQIVRDPARLIDEAMAQSLVGGRRVIFVRLGTENISDSLKDLFKAPEMGSMVILEVLEAGLLPKSSPVRKLMEKEYHGAVVACYEDNQASLNQLLSEVFGQVDLRVSQEARDYLLNNLGSDRLVSRQELEKVILYAGDNQDISLEDVAAIVGDNSVLSIENIVFAVAGGNKVTLDIGLARATAEGITPIALIRATQRHIHRLLLAGAACADGMTPNEAMKILRPPVLFMFAEQFRQQLRMWSPSFSALALSLLTKSEIECKSTGLPDRAIVERTLLRVSQIARTC